jgi:hypothetical protein
VNGGAMANPLNGKHEILTMVWCPMDRQKERPVIEGNYTVSGEVTRPILRREPLFNHWRNAIPLLVYVAIKLVWMWMQEDAKRPATALDHAIGFVLLSLFVFATISLALRNRSRGRAAGREILQ